MSKKLETVTLVMARARIMQKSFRREERLLNRKCKNQELTLAAGWAAVTFFNLYLASMHVLVEAWDNSLFYDADIYRLLEIGDRDELRRFRNAVFHPGPFDDKRLLAVYRDHRKALGWADELLDAVGRFVKRETRSEQALGSRGPT